MGFFGMDTEQGEAFAQLIGDRKSQIEERAEQLDGVVGRIDSIWRGPDAESFRVDWEQLRSTQIRDAVERLWDLARELSDHAQEQDITSAEGFGVLGEMLGDIFPLGGGLENPLLAFTDPRNWLTGLMGVPGDIGEEMLENAWRVFAKGGEEAVVPWLKTAHGFKAAGKWLGPAGDVLTGVFAGVDRWNEDAGDPSLSNGERTTRAVVDGGVNAAGAIAGGLAGAKGGAALGAAIGSVIPGAGTAVGGAVGGIVGGVVGGIVGGGVADAVIDWILG